MVISVCTRDCLKIINIFLLIVQCVLDVTRLRWDIAEGRGCHWCSCDCQERILVPRNPLLITFWILWSTFLYISNAVLVYAILKEMWNYVDSSIQTGVMKCILLLIDLYLVIVSVSKHSGDDHCKTMKTFFSMEPSAILFVLFFFAITGVQILIQILLYLLITTSPGGRKYIKHHYLCTRSKLENAEVVCRRTTVERITVFLIWLVLSIYFYLYALSVTSAGFVPKSGAAPAGDGIRRCLRQNHPSSVPPAMNITA